MSEINNLALVHEWFDKPAGSEECVHSFLNVFPNADLFSLVDFYSDEHRERFLKGKHSHTSCIQKFPFASTKFRNYLPFFPYAIEQLDVSPYNIILSSSHAVAKGIITKINQLHITYCHSPMRYAWDLYHQYINESGLRKGLKGLYAKWMLHYLRMWDFTTANRVNYFIANSRFTAARIKRIYNRDADVIYPPVDVEKFSCVSKKDNYFVTASRFAPYKKIDLIVEAFAKMPDKKLVVIGDGPELNKIKSKARSNIELAGYLPHDEMVKYFQNAKAFVFAAEEDFGIVVIQALACGTPVIALNLGGTAETVKHLVTGIHFRKQNVESLIDGVTEFEKNENRFDADAISKYAQSFSVRRFEDEIKKYVEEKANIFFNGNQ